MRRNTLAVARYELSDAQSPEGVGALNRLDAGELDHLCPLLGLLDNKQYGRVLIKRGVAAFDEFRQGVKHIKFLADPSTGELRIGCTATMAAGPVLAVIEQLTRQHPRLVFYVRTGTIATLYRALAERNVELVITGATGALAEEQTNVGSLFDDNVVVAAGARSRWARRRRIKLEELVNEPWTLPPDDSAMGAIVLEAFRARGLAPPAATQRRQNKTARYLAPGFPLARE